MAELCPSCKKGELKEFIPGFKQCSVCKKVFKKKEEEKETKKEEEEIIDGEQIMKETTLNKEYEIAEKAITIVREKNKRWIAAVLCHSPSFPDSKYIRLSWWKKSINAHAGMFRIDDLDELENVIIALKRIDECFDERFEANEKFNYDPYPGREEEKQTVLFDEKKRLCIKCGYKMKLSSNRKYYECERCGEIIILEDGKPVFNIPPKELPLSFTANFPVKYYLPDYGITVGLTMAVWKALVIIHAKENPNKKWLRFYWWTRDLQGHMTSTYNFGMDQGMKWEAKRGIASPNIYEKELIPKIIKALEKLGEIWREETKSKKEEEEDYLIKLREKLKETRRKKSQGKKSTRKRRTTRRSYRK